MPLLTIASLPSENTVQWTNYTHWIVIQSHVYLSKAHALRHHAALLASRCTVHGLAIDISGDFKLGSEPWKCQTQEHLHFYKLRTEKSSKSQGMNVYGRISDGCKEATGAWGRLKILRWAGSQSWERRSWLPCEAHAGCEMSAYSQMVDLRCL